MKYQIGAVFKLRRKGRVVFIVPDPDSHGIDTHA